MLVTKLKECVQSTLMNSSGHGYSDAGICYYMATYVEDKIWDTGNFDQLEAKAKSAVPLTIAQAGKTGNLKDRDRQFQHRNNAGYVEQAATNKKVYQVSIWFGAAANAPGAKDLNNCNHQIVAAFSTTGMALIFDPNFGFFKATEDARPNQEVVEEVVQGFYQGVGSLASNFYYLPGRKIS